MDNFSGEINKTKNMTQTQALLDEWDKKQAERHKSDTKYQYDKNNYSSTILAKEKAKQKIIENASHGIYETKVVSALKLTGKKKKDKAIIKEWYKKNYSLKDNEEDTAATQAEQSTLSTFVKENTYADLPLTGCLSENEINSAEARLRVRALDTDKDLFNLDFFLNDNTKQQLENRSCIRHALKDPKIAKLFHDSTVKNNGFDKLMADFIKSESAKDPSIAGMNEKDKTERLFKSKFFKDNYDPFLSDFLKEKNIRQLFKADAKTDDAKEALEADKKKFSVIMKDCSEINLFDGTPRASDVRQSNVGDCYFLAALASKAENNPQSILDMMHENKDGTVTVRFYNHYTENGSDISEPVYITVNKSRPCAGFDDEYVTCANKGKLWVSIVEKAFVASKLHSQSDVITPFNEPYDHTYRRKMSVKNGYDDIASGNGEQAFRYLGKEPLKTIYLHEHNVNYDIELGEGPTAISRSLSAVFSSDHSITDASTHKIKAGILQQLQNKYNIDTNGIDLRKFLKELREHDQSLIKQGKGGAYRTHMASMEDVIKTIARSKAFNNEKQREVFATALTDILQNNSNNMLNFRRFSGKYTKHAEDIYQTVRNAEAHKRHMTAGSITYLSDNEKKYRKAHPSEFQSGQNGENLSKGIYQAHEYSVMGALERDKKKFLIIRNPWGHSEIAYSKMKNGKYDMNSSELKEKNKDAAGGTFLIELNDFLTRFRFITFNK
jgi:hypothetical protein